MGLEMQVHDAVIGNNMNICMLEPQYHLSLNRKAIHSTYAEYTMR